MEVHAINFNWVLVNDKILIFQLMLWKFAQFYSFTIENGEKQPIVSSAAFSFVPFPNNTHEESCPAKTSVFKLQGVKKQPLCLKHAHILVHFHKYEEILENPVE